MQGKANEFMQQPQSRNYLDALEGNSIFFSGMSAAEYAEMSPHVKHSEVYRLYVNLVDQVFHQSGIPEPEVLDLGAGEGSVTVAFLQRGAQVTAVDSSSSQLAELQSKCAPFGGRLSVIHDEVFSAIAQTQKKFDVVAASSFLHHIPDYFDLIEKAVRLLRPRGQLFLFQDPLRYDSLPRVQYWFSTLSYLCWRARRPDRIGGLKRRVRRARGVYNDPVFDNGEYHVTRNGVDQDALVARLQSLSFHCELIKYFSTQSAFFQRLGTYLSAKNTFAIIARHQP